MSQIISKEEFEELMKIKGETRGMSLKGEGNFILKQEGEEGLKKLEKTIAELGYPIKFKEIKAMDFYPLGLEVVTLVAIKRLFNYDDEKFREMGRFESKLSFIIRLFMKYFFSMKQAIKVAPKMWKENYTVGDLEVPEFDEEKKYAIIKIKNFQGYPLLCLDLQGYFPGIVQMIVGTPATCQETKCVHRGDEYHEFVLKW